MNKKEFDRRMESAVGILGSNRGWPIFFLVLVGFILFASLYFITSTYEPDLKSTLIDAYCLQEAPLGCFDIPASVIPGADSGGGAHYRLPWSFFVRQLLLFPTAILAYLFSWILRGLRFWKFYWISLFLFSLSVLNVWAVMGEGLFDAGVIDFFWREIFAWCNLVLMLFMLTLSLWNRKLLEKLAIFERVAMLVGGLGGGGAALGVLLSRLFSRSKSGPSAFMIMGLVFNFLIVVVAGMKSSQFLWNASPWRLEAEIRARENGDDPEKWAKIKKLIF